jgi:hypothetical protein
VPAYSLCVCFAVHISSWCLFALTNAFISPFYVYLPPPWLHILSLFLFAPLRASQCNLNSSMPIYPLYVCICTLLCLHIPLCVCLHPVPAFCLLVLFCTRQGPACPLLVSFALPNACISPLCVYLHSTMPAYPLSVFVRISQCLHITSMCLFAPKPACSLVVSICTPPCLHFPICMCCLHTQWLNYGVCVWHSVPAYNRLMTSICFILKTEIVNLICIFCLWCYFA